MATCHLPSVAGADRRQNEAMSHEHTQSSIQSYWHMDTKCKIFNTTGALSMTSCAGVVIKPEKADRKHELWMKRVRLEPWL